MPAEQAASALRITCMMVSDFIEDLNLVVVTNVKPYHY